MTHCGLPNIGAAMVVGPHGLVHVNTVKGTATLSHWSSSVNLDEGFPEHMAFDRLLAHYKHCREIPRGKRTSVGT